MCKLPKRRMWPLLHFLTQLWQRLRPAEITPQPFWFLLRCAQLNIVHVAKLHGFMEDAQHDKPFSGMSRIKSFGATWAATGKPPFSHVAVWIRLLGESQHAPQPGVTVVWLMGTAM